jgi:hypothetical protein
MPTNLLKTYSQLLEIAHYNEAQRTNSLKAIFNRDIENNEAFLFNKKTIRPIKKEGGHGLQILFTHLTTREDEDENGVKLNTRSFESSRSIRLHWIKHHIDLRCENMDVFSYEDRIDGRDVIRTYLYNVEQQYVIILEPQRSKQDYYLLTAYFLNERKGKKQIEKKRKNKLPDVH